MGTSKQFNPVQNKAEATYAAGNHAPSLQCVLLFEFVLGFTSVSMRLGSGWVIKFGEKLDM